MTGCAAFALPRPAEAHPDSSIEVGGALIAEAVFGGPVAVGGLITGLHNGSVAAGGAMITPAWKTMGYVFGGLNLASSVAWIAFTVGVSNSDARALGVGLGLTHLVVGALGIGFTSMSPAKRRRDGAALVLVPIALRDHRGQLAPGAGVIVSNF